MLLDTEVQRYFGVEPIRGHGGEVVVEIRLVKKAKAETGEGGSVREKLEGCEEDGQEGGAEGGEEAEEGEDQEQERSDADSGPVSVKADRPKRRRMGVDSKRLRNALNTKKLNAEAQLLIERVEKSERMETREPLHLPV